VAEWYGSLKASSAGAWERMKKGSRMHIRLSVMPGKSLQKNSAPTNRILKGGYMGIEIGGRHAVGRYVLMPITWAEGTME